MDINATASSGALPGNARQTDSYVIAVMNQKGGVAKTMVALSLAAHTVAAYGRALVVDVDPQANAYDLTRAMEDPGYEVVHELDPVQLTRIRQLRDFDTILVDCPGSLEGRNVLAEVLDRSTFVIIPYDHQPESVLPTIRTARSVRKSGVPYAAVVTKADPRLGAEFIVDAWNTLEKAGIRHFRTVIREQADLATCEAALDNLRVAFWAAGKALQVIRDARLYRDTHATFEDYVEQRWDMARSPAYRLIDAWPLAERLSPMGDKLNERQ